MKIKESNITILFIYILLAVVLRFFSFFPSVINHDESTYIVIADAIRAGQLYWVDIIDTKPIGIFLLFSIFQELFGEPVPVIRVMTAMWIALTAFGLYGVQKALGGKGNAALASGLIYIFITSIFTFYGLSPNTELFFNLFTIAAFWLILSRQQWWSYLIGGLLLGFGFMIKYVVLFDAVVVALFLAWLAYRKHFTIGKLVTKYLLIVFGFCIPFGITLYYYTSLGHQEAFLFFTFELSGRYFVDPHWSEYFIYLGDFFLRFFPVTIWFLISLFQPKALSINSRVLLGIWSVVAMFIILLPGRFFGHYFVQFMLPYCLIAGSFFDSRRSHSKLWQKLLSPKVGYVLLGSLFVLSSYFQWNDNYAKVDMPKEVASYLRPLLKQDDIIYTGNYHMIVYHLVDKKSPTPYLHRSLLIQDKNLYALNIDHDEEMLKILQQRPKFIITQEEYWVGDSILNAALEDQYELIKRFEGEAIIYQRK